MSANQSSETGPNEAGKRGWNVSDECLSLMRFNYENLDRAVWKAHQFSWFMTSIFVPVILGGLGYLLKELDDIGVVGIVGGAVVVVGVTWFWYMFTRILARYNGRRFKQLMKLEEAFDKCYPAGLVWERKQFVQYRGIAGGHSGLRFRYVALGFAIFLSVVSAGIAMMKIVLSLLEGAGAM